MKEQINKIIEDIVTHPKTSSLFALGIVEINNLWIEWGNPFFEFITKVAGFVLIVILILYHNENRKKVARENREHGD